MKLTDKQKQFIKNNYQKMLYSEIASVLEISKTTIKNYINNNGLKLKPEEYKRRIDLSRFKKGNIAWNKGLNLPNKPNSGQFKKGNTPPNTKFDGYISLRKRHNRINQDYYWIRISKSKWKELHIYNWEKVNGSIKKGDIIRFKDGNHKNCAIENLELVSRAKHLKINQENGIKDKLESNKAIAAYITREKHLKREILKHPELIEIKRLQLKLEKTLTEKK